MENRDEKEAKAQKGEPSNWQTLPHLNETLISTKLPRVLPVFRTLDLQPGDSICSFKRELPALREVDISFVTVSGKRISGAYDGRSQPTTWGTYLEMEHSAANAKKSEWNLIVKCRKKVRTIQETFSISHWANITEVFPDAEVKMLGKKVHLNLTEAMKNYEFAVFGKPGKNDRKRMQLGIFGSKPEKAQDWKIYVTLFDDTLMAFKHARDVEKGRGRRLLTTLAGLFVSNSDEDIKIDLSMLAVGWQIKGNKIQVIKSEDAWNYLENSTDFPRCCFVISHEDMRKKSFYCEIAASHGTDTAETALVEHFEEEEKRRLDLRRVYFDTFCSKKLTFADKIPAILKMEGLEAIKKGSNSGGNSTEFRAWNVAIPHLRGRIAALGRG